ncbi:DUF2628 domain-containing protein [Roseomonas sp. CCTCC AB2023176]|uniref:DUF2628 domain-containing protein n=1 Tax=Roseomonas sp. CCTCC AB2023176 TaxID=3342640 RepID=UPI0035DEF521
MRLYTLHAKAGDRPRTRLVREGSSFWAFLFGPFWFLARGLWLGALLALFVPVAGAALGALVTAGLASADPSVTLDLMPWTSLAAQILLGLHARDLERWMLRRRGYALHGVVAGRDHEDALLRAVTLKPDLAPGAVA